MVREEASLAHTAIAALHVAGHRGDGQRSRLNIECEQSSPLPLVEVQRGSALIGRVLLAPAIFCHKEPTLLGCPSWHTIAGASNSSEQSSTSRWETLGLTGTHQLVRGESQETLGLACGDDIVEHQDPRSVAVDLHLLWPQSGVGRVGLVITPSCF